MPRKPSADRNDALDRKYAKLIATVGNTGDNEVDHSKCDSLLCELLSDLGFNHTVAAFDEMRKDFWYA